MPSARSAEAQSQQQVQRARQQVTVLVDFASLGPQTLEIIQPFGWVCVGLDMYGSWVHADSLKAY